MIRPSIPRAVLALLVFSSAVGLRAQIISLAASTTPNSGQAGITNVNVTGSNFPSGTISPSNVTVTLAPANGGASVTTTAKSITTIVGSTRRVTFQIPGTVSVSSATGYLVSISGTAGTVSFASSNASALTINPAASLAPLSPSSGVAGQTVTVTITGQFTNFVQGSTRAIFGTAISVNGGAKGGYGLLTVTSATSATAQLAIDPAAAAGVRNITVATGIQQASLVGGFTVSVPNHPPVANAGGPYTSNVGQALTLNASASSDPDGDPLTFTWSFGDGGTGTGATPSHTYPTFGTFTASVTANDGRGGTNTATATVAVNSIPVANAGGPYSGSLGQSISFTAAASTDADNDPLNYTWNFGDGASGTGVNPTHSYMTSGSFTVSVSVDDGRGGTNTAMAVATIAGSTSVPVPVVTITSPAALGLFSQNTMNVTGTADSTATSVVVNGVAATLANGVFTANNIPLREGNNLLTATATNSSGGAGTATIAITLDTTPPTVSIDSPSNGALVSSPQVTVTGMVNDLVSGTVNAGEVTVTVNGITASVSNRSYVVNNLLLTPGTNSITAVAADRVGNTSQAQVQVTLQTVANQQHIVAISGNNQSGMVGTLLPQPLTVQLVDANGSPISNRSVTFSVVKNNGVLLASPAPGQQITMQTDNNGFASAQLQLGTRVGSGNNVVGVTSTGFVGEVMFSASSLIGQPAQIIAYSGNGQRGAAGQPLPEPLIAFVIDSGGNPVAGVPITFTVAAGSGTLAGAATAISTTDGNGRAAVIFTIANQEGINNNVVTASFQGFGGSPTTFSASGLVPGDAAKTTVSGVVLDNANTPIPNTTATIVGTNLSALSDGQGHFTIVNAPVGKIVLMLDGRSSTRPEIFPTLAFDIVTLSGQDNTVGGPIYLPPLDTVNSQIVGGNQDVVLQMNGVPGYSFTVFANSVTFADGSHVGRVSLSQVHSDKVPMAPPNGTAPRIAGTLQPAGVHFNPPIRVQFPNTDGLAPGTVLDVYSFDHDMNTWASQGPARVSPDGSVIVSDAGFGIAKSGWHGAPPPPPLPPKNCTGAPPLCMTCDSKSGTFVPASDGQSCNDNKNDYDDRPNVDVHLKFCGGSGVCHSGTCVKNGKFDNKFVRDVTNNAIDAIMGNCIGEPLRSQLQNAIRKDGILDFDHGITINCLNGNGHSCAQDGPSGGNSISIFPPAFSDPGGCGPPDSTIFHEMIHALVGEGGSPNHNNPGSGIDPTDRVYGCEAACFHTGGGNPAACK